MKKFFFPFILIFSVILPTTVFAHPGLVMVSSTYVEPKGIDPKTPPRSSPRIGVGSVITIPATSLQAQRTLVLTASHVSQGRNTKVHLNGQSWPVIRRSADVENDIEILEITGFKGPALATYTELSRPHPVTNTDSLLLKQNPQSILEAFLQPSYLGLQTVTIQTQGLIRISHQGHFAIRPDWLSNYLSPVTYRRTLYVADLNLDNSSLSFSTLTGLDLMFHVGLIPGMSGSPLLQVMPLNGQDEVIIAGVATQQDRFFHRSYFATLSKITELIKVHLNSSTPILYVDASRWHVDFKSENTYRVFADHSVEMIPSVMPIGAKSIGDGGGKSIGDGGSKTIGDNGRKTTGDGGSKTIGDNGSKTLVDGGVKTIGDGGRKTLIDNRSSTNTACNAWAHTSDSMEDGFLMPITQGNDLQLKKVISFSLNLADGRILELYANRASYLVAQHLQAKGIARVLTHSTETDYFELLSRRWQQNSTLRAKKWSCRSFSADPQGHQISLEGDILKLHLSLMTRDGQETIDFALQRNGHLPGDPSPFQGVYEVISSRRNRYTLDMRGLFFTDLMSFQRPESQSSFEALLSPTYQYRFFAPSVRLRPYCIEKDLEIFFQPSD